MSIAKKLTKNTYIRVDTGGDGIIYAPNISEDAISVALRNKITLQLINGEQNYGDDVILDTFEDATGLRNTIDTVNSTALYSSEQQSYFYNGASNNKIVTITLLDTSVKEIDKISIAEITGGTSITSTPTRVEISLNNGTNYAYQTLSEYKYVNELIDVSGLPKTTSTQTELKIRMYLDSNVILPANLNTRSSITNESPAFVSFSSLIDFANTSFIKKNNVELVKVSTSGLIGSGYNHSKIYNVISNTWGAEFTNALNFGNSTGYYNEIATVFIDHLNIKYYIMHAPNNTTTFVSDNQSEFFNFNFLSNTYSIAATGVTPKYAASCSTSGNTNGYAIYGLNKFKLQYRNSTSFLDIANDISNSGLKWNNSGNVFSTIPTPGTYTEPSVSYPLLPKMFVACALYQNDSDFIYIPDGLAQDGNMRTIYKYNGNTWSPISNVSGTHYDGSTEINPGKISGNDTEFFLDTGITPGYYVTLRKYNKISNVFNNSYFSYWAGSIGTTSSIYNAESGMCFTPGALYITADSYDSGISIAYLQHAWKLTLNNAFGIKGYGVKLIYK